eukprot:TRINITY_DN12073_c0_g1_i1.p1 TRINITY_DN12073_c0_g1~~TRINITY_DN12073_c0_g1_i1.p1  ORF type:complete len:994 (+),score=195.18 TRINITY_DN12073_c0_g1_i1:79-3060(+)
MATIRAVGAALVAAAAGAGTCRGAGVTNPEEYVNTLQGTWSTTEYSTGGTLPLVGRPWGMSNWAPHTADLLGSGGRWFHPDNRRFFGIRCTHQPSPWIGDYSYFWVSAQVGKYLKPGAAFGGYDPKRAETNFKPYLFNATVFMHDTDVAVTATERAAAFQFRFPALRRSPVDGADQRRRILFTLPGSEKDWIDVNSNEVSGWTHSNSGGVPDSWRMYFYARVRAPVQLAEAGRHDCGAGSGSMPVQLSRIDLWAGKQRIDMSAANATNPGGNNPIGEGPEHVLDASNETKWLDFNREPLVMRFPSAVSPDSFTFTTASDSPDRDPIRWGLDASDNGVQWTEVSKQEVDYPVQLARSLQSAHFPIAPPGVGHRWWRFRPLKVRAQQADDSCAAAILSFDETNPATDTVEFAVGTSFISVEQARRNLDREVGGRSFAEVLAESKEVWRRQLGRITVADSGLVSGSAAERERLSAFYGSLYHASMFPHRLTEYDAAGRPVHFSPYTGAVAEGVLSTDHGFWDAYRTVYPLQNLLFADHAGELLQGFVNAFKEGGWLPAWPSPGYRSSMVGTFQDLVLADAMVKNVTGFSWKDAYSGMLRDADHEPAHDVVGGRESLSYCMQLGYCPHTVHESTARTLNYAYADFGVAQAARLLGHRGDHDRLARRSRNYRNIFDPRTQFFRPRHSNGSFVEPFDQYAWGGDYTEGGPWTFRLEAVWDMPGMAALFGGPESLCDKVDEMLAEPPRYTQGGYPTQIHEQVELPLLREPVPNAENFIPWSPSQQRTGFGQYEQNNQPSHHLLYVAAAAGCPERTEYWVRQVMDKLYSSTHFCGDEDNGEMGAWHVFSAIGIYPLVPATDSYVTGSPLMRNVTVALPGGSQLTIVAHGNSNRALYVSRVALNGSEVNKAALRHSDLVRGGLLEFWMSETPAGSARRTAPHLLGSRAWGLRAADLALRGLSQWWTGWAAFLALAAQQATLRLRRRRVEPSPKRAAATPDRA